MKSLNVAIAGLGTIGSGVAHVLEEHEKYSDSKINLVRILENNYNSKKSQIWMNKKNELFCTDPKIIIENPEIDVIVETIGGKEFSRELITKALENGKHVITANKDLIAVHGKELTDIARKNVSLMKVQTKSYKNA